MLTYLVGGVIGLGFVAVIVSLLQKNRDRGSQSDSSGYDAGAHWMTTGDDGSSHRHYPGDGHDHSDGTFGHYPGDGHDHGSASDAGGFDGGSADSGGAGDSGGGGGGGGGD